MSMENQDWRAEKVYTHKNKIKISRRRIRKNEENEKLVALR